MGEESRSLGGDEWRWRKDVRSRENAARSRSKVAAYNPPPSSQAAAYNPPPHSQIAAYNPPSPSQAVAYNPLPQAAANQELAHPQVAHLPSRVGANQPISILEEKDVQEFSSTPKTEEVRKPK